MKPWVALVNSPETPEGAPDDPVLVAACSAAGLDTRQWNWRDGRPEAEPLAYLLRSPWDYHEDPQDFLAWTASLPPSALWNPAPLVAWNSDKRYLFELQAGGVEILPTRLLPRGSRWVPIPEWAELELVCKPTCSANALNTRRFPAGRLDEEWLHRLLQTRDMLVQPYFAAIETYGERSLVFIDGEFQHAVQRTEALREGQLLESLRPLVQPSEAEHAVARRVLQLLPVDPLYARIDLVEGARVMEVEVIEPQLFLREFPPAAEALVAGLERRL